MNPIAMMEAEQQLAVLLARFADSPMDAREMEPDLARFLAIVRAHPDDRAQFVHMFTQMIAGNRPSPEWLVAYCMHELRWPEVLEVARAELSRNHPSTLSLAAETVESFSDDWFGTQLFGK